MNKNLETIFTLPSPIQPLDLSYFGIENNKVFIKRDDLIHKVISGNKWRKLKLNIAEFLKSDKKGILTFGGAYSNHILAIAYVANKLNIPSVAIVRGEKPKIFSSTLKKCKLYNMKFIFVSRNDYKNKDKILDKVLLNNSKLSSFYIIPEGGANKLGILGCTEIVKEIDLTYNFDEIYCDVGTGATLAGLTLGIKPKQKIIGINVLKGAEYLEKDIQNMICSVNIKCDNKFYLLNNYHFGGYAKNNAELIHFMRDFYKHTGIKTDPIYSGKMFYALVSELKKGSDNKNILAIHSGGLQGIEGFEKRYKLKIF